MSDKFTSEYVVSLLRNKYSDDRYIVLEQVANFPGFGATQYIDVIVVDLWPSGGLQRLAFEVKVSRSDFLKEINDPNKNSYAKAHYHQFWYVAPKGVIEEASEVPDGCGWLEVQKDRLITRLAARRVNAPESGDNLLGCILNAVKRDRKQMRNEIADDIRKNDAYIQRSIKIATETEKLLSSRHVYLTDKNLENLSGLMVDTLRDDDVKATLHHIECVAKKLQNELLDAWEYLTIVCFCGIMTTGENGKFILDGYTNRSAAFDIAARLAAAKEHPNRDDFQKKFAELLKVANQIKP